MWGKMRPAAGDVASATEGDCLGPAPRKRLKRLPLELERKEYDTLTVLVPGTFAPVGPLPTWYEASADRRSLNAYLQEHVFPGEEFYVFHWNSWGLTSYMRHRQRVNAAKRLLRELQSVPIRNLRIVGHSHGANVASMVTRDDLIRRRHGLHVHTLVLLSPAVEPREKSDRYHPDMHHVGDKSLPVEERRFFTFHPEYDGVLATRWGQNYQHTALARYEKLHGKIAPNHHWSSTFPDIWEAEANRLADLIRAA
jgi:hypothetical protein